MAALTTQIEIPVKLAQEIDELAGPHGRSAFIVALAENEVRRQKMLAFLKSDKPAWRDEDHPDIAEAGAAAWVHNLRRERSPRQEHLDKLASETND